jgi:hypothetical protein
MQLLVAGKNRKKAKEIGEKLLKEVRVFKTRWTTDQVNFLKKITKVLQ